jgi:hypothetical protein
MDGGTWDLIVRKVAQDAMLFAGNPLWLLIPLVLVIFGYILGRPNWWAAASLRRPFTDFPLLRPGLIAILIMWVVGFALNDPGAAIPAVGAALAAPLVIVIAIRDFDEQSVAQPVLTRASRHRR